MLVGLEDGLPGDPAIRVPVLVGAEGQGVDLRGGERVALLLELHGVSDERSESPWNSQCFVASLLVQNLVFR